MRGEDLGFIRLSGPDRNTWRHTYQREFVALDSKAPEDWLTRCVTHLILNTYHFLIGRHIHKVCHGLP
jgi:hypothetical protein